MMTRTTSSLTTHNQEVPNLSNSSVSSKLCSICFSTIAKGYLHNCSSISAVENLILLALSLGNLQAEQVASSIIKAKMETDEIANGEQFILSSGGNPLMITVGCPDNKAKRRYLYTVEYIFIK
jgi:hypothetical protein